ncbi:MAG: FkbM family methyltransferase [Candidatus Competibacteraceae bacterium]
MEELLALPLSLQLLRRFPLPHKLGLLERIYGKTLGNKGIRWVECSNGVRWKLDLSDVCQRWIIYGDYEGSRTMNWLRAWLKNGGTVVDSGANIGQILLYLAPFPNVKFYAVEPLPEAIAWLKECLAAQSSWDVRVITSGLADQPKEISLQCAGAQSTTRLDWYSQKHFEKTFIQVDTFDNLMTKYNEQSIRLWKIDVEGAEYEALLGARSFLQRHAVDAIFLELIPQNFHRVKEYLRGFGYELFVLESRGALTRVASMPNAVVNLIATHQSNELLKN